MGDAESDEHHVQREQRRADQREQRRANPSPLKSLPQSCSDMSPSAACRLRTEVAGEHEQAKAPGGERTERGRDDQRLDDQDSGLVRDGVQGG